MIRFDNQYDGQSKIELRPFLAPLYSKCWGKIRLEFWKYMSMCLYYWTTIWRRAKCWNPSTSTKRWKMLRPSSLLRTPNIYINLSLSYSKLPNMYLDVDSSSKDRARRARSWHHESTSRSAVDWANQAPACSVRCVDVSWAWHAHRDRACEIQFVQQPIVLRTNALVHFMSRKSRDGAH
jgi:hypothetical protein